MDQVQELCRILACLNYSGQQTIVSPETLAKPNFNLVSDILNWMATIVQEPDDYDFKLMSKTNMIDMPESDRINYLLQIGKFFHYKLDVKLNLINLYRADKYSCIELLKIAKCIFKAAQLSIKTSSEINTLHVEKITSERNQIIEELSNLIKRDEIERISSLEELAIELELLLQDEMVKFNQDRSITMERRLETKEIEKLLANTQIDLQNKTDQLAKANQELQNDIKGLDKRLESKESELEVTKSKLDDLMIHSPAYYGQYSKLHKQYEHQYEAYVSKFRNYAYLTSVVYPADQPGTNQTSPSLMSYSKSFPLHDNSFPLVTNKFSKNNQEFTSQSNDQNTTNEIEQSDKTQATSTTQENNLSLDAKRPATGVDLKDIELESLLNEFVADSAKLETDYVEAELSLDEDEVEEEEDGLSDDDDDCLVADF